MQELKTKVKRYMELKEILQKMRKEPIGNRIKKGGILEQRIKKVFPKRANQILKRTDSYTFDQWDMLKTEFVKLRNELEERNIITYNEEYEEIINVI